MNLKSILILLTTITLSTAIPFAQKTPAPKPTPTVKTVDPILNSLAAAAAAASTGKNICPLSKRSKQCCQSVNSIADTITEPIGEVIPLLKGAKLSSLLGFDCMAMADTDPNDYCGKDVMCCTGKPGQNVQGGDIFKTCEPFDEAIKKKQKALDKQNQRPVEKAMSYVAMTSSMAAAAASRSAAASSSAIFTSGSISASPTGH